MPNDNSNQRFFTNIKGTVESESISTEVLNATLYNEPSMNHLDGILTGGYGSTDSSGQYVDLHSSLSAKHIKFNFFCVFLPLGVLGIDTPCMYHRGDSL